MLPDVPTRADSFDFLEDLILNVRIDGQEEHEPPHPCCCRLHTSHKQITDHRPSLFVCSPRTRIEAVGLGIS